MNSNDVNVGLNGYMMPSNGNAQPELPRSGGAAIPAIIRIQVPGQGEHFMTQEQYQMALAQQAQHAQQRQQAAVANYYAQQRQQHHPVVTGAQAQQHAQVLSKQQLPGMNHVQPPPTYVNVNMNGQVISVMSANDQHSRVQPADADLQSGRHGAHLLRPNQTQVLQPGQPATQMVMMLDGNGQQRMVQMVMAPGISTQWNGRAMAPPPPPPQTPQPNMQVAGQVARPPAVSLGTKNPNPPRLTMLYQPSEESVGQVEQSPQTSHPLQAGSGGWSSEKTDNVAQSDLHAHKVSPINHGNVVTRSPARMHQQTLGSNSDAGSAMPSAATHAMMRTQSTNLEHHSRAQGSMGPPSTLSTGQRFAGTDYMHSQISPPGRIGPGMGMGMGVGAGTARVGRRKRITSIASESVLGDVDTYVDSVDGSQSPRNPTDDNADWDAPSMLSPGRGVLRLLQFCCSMREMEQAQNLQFCKNTVASWFADQGKITYVLSDKVQGAQKTFELPFATLPRWFHANSLIRDRGTSFTFINPREENIPIDPSTQDSEPNEGDARALRVVSENATWTSTFANGTHVTSSGSVKAVMVPDTALGDLRIRSIVFTLALHDEWILRAALQKGELLDQPADGIMLDLDVAIVKAACASNSSPALSTNNIKLETTPRTETSSLPSVASSKGSVKNRKPKPLSKRQRREQAKREEAEAEARDSEKESADDERRLQEETAQVDLMSLSMRRDTTASKVSSEGMASRQVSSDIAWPFPESRVDEYGITHEAMRYLELVQGTMQLQELFAICASENIGPRDALRRAAARAREQMAQVGYPDRSGNDSAIGSHQNLQTTPLQAEGTMLRESLQSHLQTPEPTQGIGAVTASAPATNYPVYPITPGGSQLLKSSSAPGIIIPASSSVSPPSPVRVAAALAATHALKRKFAASAALTEQRDNDSSSEVQMSVTVRNSAIASPHTRE